MLALDPSTLEAKNLVVFIPEFCDYEDSELGPVFATKELAEQWIAKEIERVTSYYSYYKEYWHIREEVVHDCLP